jgi:hypothetical protein
MMINTKIFKIGISSVLHESIFDLFIKFRLTTKNMKRLSPCSIDEVPDNLFNDPVYYIDK